MDQTVRILGVPMDLGADRRGVDMGPSAIRYAGLADQLDAIDRDCVDGGDIAVPRPEEREEPTDDFGDGPTKYLRETREVCEDIATAVGATVADGEFPLVLGGDHSIAIGTAAGVADGRKTGLLWFDAHGDFNTPATTPSGNIHGMTLAAILGVGPFADAAWAHTPSIPPKNVALVGIRDLDRGERETLRESPATVYTMTDIDERGITDIVESAVDVVSEGADQVHVSFDVDSLDPTEAPGVGTPVRGGISYREAHAAMELVHSRLDARLCGFEVVEVNPTLDEHNRTAELACELVASALGKRIL